MTTGRWIFAAVLVLVLFFAVQGGEYSTLQWLDLRRQERVERARLVDLQRRVDSLARYVRQVQNDPETQERIAREQHGMLRKGEHAFILLDEDRDR